MMIEEGTVVAVDVDGTCVTHEYPNVGIGDRGRISV
jgi:hypothetical protein